MHRPQANLDVRAGLSETGPKRGGLRNLAAFIPDLLAATAAAIWGLNTVVVKQGLSSIHPLANNSARFSLASFLLLALLWFTERDLRVDRRDLIPFALLGFTGQAIHPLFYVLALNSTAAGRVAVFMAMTPVGIASISQALRMERYSWRGWAGILTSAAGAFFMVSGKEGFATLLKRELAGDLFALVAMLTWAGYTIGSRPLLSRYSALKVTAFCMVSGTVASLPYSLPSVLRQDWRAVATQSWLAIAYSSVFAVVGGTLLWTWGVQRIGSGRTAIYHNISPVVASTAGWLALGERWLPLQAAGALLILLGVAQVRVGVRNQHDGGG